MPAVQDGGWYASLATFAYGVAPGKMLRSDWKQNRHLRDFLDLSRVGERPTRGPILVVAGIDDSSIPESSVRDGVERMRKQGSTVEYRTYAGLDHDPLMFGSFRDQFQWVADRFAGKPFSGPLPPARQG